MLMQFGKPYADLSQIFFFLIFWIFFLDLSQIACDYI